MSASAWKNRLESIKYYKSLWTDCHLCGKPRLKLGPHMRTAYGWSAMDEQRYRFEQEAALQEIPEGAHKRKLSWSEFTENDNQQVRHRISEIIDLRFRTLDDCLTRIYRDIRDIVAQTLIDMPSGGDIVDGRKDIHDDLERVLNPSFVHLESTNRSEKTRLMHSLTELAHGEYV